MTEPPRTAARLGGTILVIAGFAALGYFLLLWMAHSPGRQGDSAWHELIAGAANYAGAPHLNLLRSIYSVAILGIAAVTWGAWLLARNRPVRRRIPAAGVLAFGVLLLLSQSWIAVYTSAWVTGGTETVSVGGCRSFSESHCHIETEAGTGTTSRIFGDPEPEAANSMVHVESPNNAEESWVSYTAPGADDLGVLAVSLLIVAAGVWVLVRNRRGFAAAES